MVYVGAASDDNRPSLEWARSRRGECPGASEVGDVVGKVRVDGCDADWQHCWLCVGCGFSGWLVCLGFFSR